MSMSTYVVGFREPDEKWLKMKAIWDACRLADVDPPDEVETFFGHTRPDAAGVLVAIGANYGDLHPCCTPFNADAAQGFEVDISKLPTQITKLRFYNSW